MTIDVEDFDSVKLLRLRGELTGEHRKALVEAVTDLLAETNRGIIIDLEHISYMNSAGLSELVRLAAQANVQEQRLILANPSAYIVGVLEMTKLNRFFELCTTTEEAFRRLE
jgi:anti-sigma B factor antagonist